MLSIMTGRPKSSTLKDSVTTANGSARQWRATLPVCFFVCSQLATLGLAAGWTFAAAGLAMRGQETTAPRHQPSSEIGELSLDNKDDLQRLESLEAPIANQKLQDVVPDLTTYLKEHPESARGHYDLGYVFFRTHQLAPAVTQLSTSLKLNLNNAEAHKILGLVCNLLGRYDLAERELEAAAELKPDTAEIHYLLGRLYYTKGVYPLARREFESAVRLDPAYMKAHNNLGLTMEVLGNNSAALQNYILAEQLDQDQKLNSEWPYVYLSAYYNRHEKPEQALQYSEMALARNPKSDLAYFQMAKAYRTQGEWEKSVEADLQAIDINPSTPDFYYVLSNSLRKLGKTSESDKAMETFRKLRAADAAKAQQRVGSNEPPEPTMILRDDE